MSSFGTSSVPTELQINSDSISRRTKMFGSHYNKMLQDPDCQSHCCSSHLGQSVQENMINNMSQLLPSQIRENPLGARYSESYYESTTEMAQSSFSSSSTLLSTEVRHRQRSCCKGVLKRKRKRTVFTTEQIVLLEGVFKKRPYVSREERSFLTHKLNISEKAIKIWFQNRRRLTEKREKDGNQSDSCNSDSTVEEECNDFASRIDNIESQIIKNIDEYGFVTLDNEALVELVKLIDIVLTTEVKLNNCNSIMKSREENFNGYTMYEPISPESLYEDHKDSEDISKWEPSEPEESLQRLIDIQTVLFG